MRAGIAFAIAAWLVVLVLGAIVLRQQREIQSLRGTVATDSIAINALQYYYDQLLPELDLCRRDFRDLAKTTSGLAMKRKAK